MGISIILAKSKNNVIGKDNDLPWKLPTDLKKFKEITLNSTIIMGRKCYESIGRPLPKRINVVLTRDENFTADGCEVRHNLEAAIEEFKEEGKELFIIGGSHIYKESFKYADKLYITQIMSEVAGDVILEGLIEEDWILTGLDGPYREDGLDYHFEEYVAKRTLRQRDAKESDTE